MVRFKGNQMNTTFCAGKGAALLEFLFQWKSNIPTEAVTAPYSEHLHHNW